MNLALHSIQFVEKLDVCICVDEPFSDRLDTIIEPISNIHTVGKYTSYLAFKEALPYIKFQCLIISRKVGLMDFYDFLDLVKEINASGARIVFISDPMPTGDLKMLIKSKIGSIVYERDSFLNILKAIKDAQDQYYFISNYFLESVLSFFWVQSDISITSKEVAVLNGVKSGLKYSEIGESLNMSQETVRVHLKKIYKKLAVENKSQALVRALELNLI